MDPKRKSPKKTNTVELRPDLYIELLKRAIGHVDRTPHCCETCSTYDAKSGLCDNTAMRFPTSKDGFCGMYNESRDWIVFADRAARKYLEQMKGKA